MKIDYALVCKRTGETHKFTLEGEDPDQMRLLAKIKAVFPPPEGGWDLYANAITAMRAADLLMMYRVLE
jgi:hypothetical protein